MVFFNDPVPCDDPAERAVRMALGMRDTVQSRRPDGWRAVATTSRSGSGSRRASRPWAGSVSRVASTTPPSGASPTWPPDCAARPVHGRCWSLTGCWRRPSTCRARESSATSTPRGSAAPVRVHNVSAIDAEAGEHMTQTSDLTAAGTATSAVRPRRARALPGVRRPATSACLPCGSRCGWISKDESVVVVPSISLDTHHRRERHRSCRPWRSAACSSCCCFASHVCG